ncbi:hypothetical protein HP397_00780 [Streptobacillus felis]|uniref:Uncharacterized protein n=1 Tax=Streptobacillus felis TaxID=1384509 RepID=A0A7Z0PEN0_9FUSO|nr:hypothetical protein [Streptobacillus felis]NYV27361.1 hypothetical protein [Streptobacillus felis]
MFNFSVLIEGENEKILLEKTEIFDLSYNFKSRNESLVLGDKEVTLSLGIKFLNDPNDKKVREKSVKNLGSILHWISKEKDYRKIEIKEILTEDEFVKYKFNNMYIEELNKKYNEENIGEYMLIFKQNLFEKNKIEVEKERD